MSNDLHTMERPVLPGVTRPDLTGLFPSAAAAVVDLTEVERSLQRKIQISGEHAVLNLEEFCVYTGRSRNWVLKYLKAGSIPGYFSVSREHHQFHLATYLALSAINRETRRKCR